jgi:hypothetical protein
MTCALSPEEAKALISKLLLQGRRLLNAPRKPIDFKTDIPEAEILLNDIEKHPHMFVLGCVMDRQINYGRAWGIAYRVGEKIGGFKFEKFRKLSRQETKKLFSKNKFHRFNDKMADCFFAAVRKIDEVYDGDASIIWNGRPASALVVRRFLEFEGIGVKIATMAANILVREFKIPMTDLHSIDISPDSRVTRFFKENGLLRMDATPAELIYLARELSPRFPGLLDWGAFIAGEYKRKF